MSFLISNAYAQGAPAAAGGGMGQIAILVVFVAIFYFMLIRPQQKRAKEQREMLARLAVGDEVATGGGLIGRITEVGDTIVTLEVATGVNVRVQRGQVTQLLPKGTLKNG
jgi:preprotein translocase subunit YajC